MNIGPEAPGIGCLRHSTRVVSGAWFRGVRLAASCGAPVLFPSVKVPFLTKAHTLAAGNCLSYGRPRKHTDQHGHLFPTSQLFSGLTGIEAHRNSAASALSLIDAAGGTYTIARNRGTSTHEHHLLPVPLVAIWLRRFSRFGQRTDKNKATRATSEKARAKAFRS